jgi:hypothetical protein
MGAAILYLRFFFRRSARAIWAFSAVMMHQNLVSASALQVIAH